jgi:succinate-acetate transporter protein
MDQKYANPAPLGLMGFGMTTVLLNIHNAGFFPVDAMILAMGIFYGGIAQVIAGILEFRKGNTFGMTAFCSYGMFWLTLVALIVMPKFDIAPKSPEGFMGWYLFVWGLFTFMMWLGTLKANRALQVVFFSLVVLFWLLAARDWTGNATIGRIAGWEGIFCGLSAIYLAMAEVLNEKHGRTLLPIGEPARKAEPSRRVAEAVYQ